MIGTLQHDGAGAQELARVVEWYPATAIVVLWGLLSTRRRVSGYRIQKLRIRHQDWFGEDFHALLELLRADKIHPVVAERLPLSEARRAHEMLEQLGGERENRARTLIRHGRCRDTTCKAPPGLREACEVAGRFRRVRTFPATSRPNATREDSFRA